MRVLIYGVNFWPELTSTGKYTGELAAWLEHAGHEVTVVTAPPYYPAWRIQSDYSGWSYRREQIGGFRVWRCPIWVPRKPQGLTRILHLLSFAISSAPVVIAHVLWRPKVVFVVAPTFLCAPTGWLAARLARGRAWLHVQDFELDVAKGLKLIGNGILAGLADRVERFWFRRFDKVSTISDRMMGRLATKGVDAKRRVLFPNWVDVEHIRPLEGSSPMRAELGIADDAVVALYAGNMGEKQGLEILIDAAKRLQQKSKIVFVLAGGGAARERLERLSADMPNIRWLPIQPAERLNDLLNLADIHLLPQRADAADLVMPSKLTGMLASGRPVVATAAKGTQVQAVVEHRGKVVPPGDAVALAARISELAGDVDLRRQLGQCARQFAVERLGRDSILGAFERELNLVAGES